jgi:Flp pilus assembly protein TadG
MNPIFHKAKRTVSRISWRGESGQAIMEFAAVVVMLMVLIFGAIDFCRAIYLRQEMVNLSRETANLEARGAGTTTMEIMTNALAAAILEAQPLGLNSSTGMVIVTAVTNVYGKGGTVSYTISQQYTAGTLAGAQSRIGTSTNVGNAAVMPSTGGTYLTSNRTVYVAEIYYQFFPITPVGNFIKAVLPTQFYDAAYFSSL